MFIMNIKKLVAKIDLVISNNTWCKWSLPATKGFLLFFKRIRFIDKNSYTKIAIDQASNIGWTKLLFARYINVNEIIKPKSKLPLSPKNIFGNLKKEKLKLKKIRIGIIIIIKNNWNSWSGIKKYKIANTEHDVIHNVPSVPSK